MMHVKRFLNHLRKKKVYHSQCIILGMSFTVCYILYCMFYYQEYYNITSPTINYLNIILSTSL